MTSLIERFEQHDERALARAISLVESRHEAGQDILSALRPKAGQAHIIGVTGSPGSGKSTLTDQLIAATRARGNKVAVLAVDPTSPYSGGAILGDRIRMMRWHSDPEVYIRSMATRGHLGGLAAKSLNIITLLDAYGFDMVFVETVGVGQSEIEIVEVADSTLLVLTPGTGDGVQAFKAGIMEIADVFVINKFDLPGGKRLKREIKAALELAHPAEGDWWPPILEAVASQGDGIDDLLEQLDAHHDYLSQGDGLVQSRERRLSFEVNAVVQSAALKFVQKHEAELHDAILSGNINETSLLKVLESSLKTTT